MLRIEQLIRVFLVLLVGVSGGLLGTSLSNFWLTSIAIASAITGFLITDRLKWFRLDGWLANIASILVLIVSMKDFIWEDSTGKLTSVAHLLIYLQALLMFQEKSPRLIWQILMLSLLQVVVAAIFSLGLEGGILFILYFIIAGVTLTLQMFYSRNEYLTVLNRSNARNVNQLIDGQNSNRSPIVFFDQEPKPIRSLSTLYFHLLGWLAVSLAFTFILFYMIPRTSSGWVGGAKVNVTAASLTKSLDLMNAGEIKQSNQLVFRVSFEEVNPRFDRKSTVSFENLYFRGMALSNLVIEDGHTNWAAPYDRVSRDHYQIPSVQLSRNSLFRQIITIEESPNPLFYSVMPFSAASQTERFLEYCHEVSALVRCRFNEDLELAPFRYELFVAANSDGEFPDTWPFIANTTGYRQASLADDSPMQEWLLNHHPERYPTLVRTAEQVIEDLLGKTPNADRREICKALESYFLEPDRFTYSLDYRSVERSLDLDPNEDFIRNHRTGHCEMYASALTLMLRSQGIPARVVVGYYGGDSSNFSDVRLIRGKHAHAWVEAYLRPEDCSPEMLTDGNAGPGGAWLRLDPTPYSSDATSAGVGAEAIDFARTIWQDYVLGMNASNNPTDEWDMASSFSKMLDNFQLERWYPTIQQADLYLKSANFRRILIALIIFPPLLTWLATLFLNYNARKRGKNEKITMRSVLAKAIALLSPRLRNWLGYRLVHQSTPFYDRMLKILRSRGYIKTSQQSHRDFARFVGQEYADHPQSKMIASVVHEVSEIFNEVRFGKHPLPTDLTEEIAHCLDDLESAVNASP